MRFLSLGLVMLRANALCSQVPAQIPLDSVRAVLLYPPMREHFVCLEHPVGQLRNLGDALGADCLVVSFGAGPSGRFPAFYTRDGSRNADWYGWNQGVLAPFTGIVDSVHVNSRTNAPGTLGRTRASIIVFRRADGVRVLYAHIQAIRVHPGDSVHAGEMVARVGNNGPAYMPHVHIAAWQGMEPLQIRFDLRALNVGH